jgi:hypothetical protein
MPPDAAEGGDRERALRSEPQRRLQQPAFAELVEPGARHVIGARGGDDAVVRRARRVALVAVAVHDADGIRGGTQRPPRRRGELPVEVDRDHAAAPADKCLEERRVVAGARADLEHALALPQLERLEHRRHHLGLRRRADRHAVCVRLRDDDAVLVDRLDALRARECGDEELARHFEERGPHVRAPERAETLELLDEQQPER